MCKLTHLKAMVSKCKNSSLHSNQNSLARENSRHLVTPQLVSPRNDVWQTSAEIPFFWLVTPQMWVVLLICLVAWENLLHAIRSNTQIWAVTCHQYGISALIALKRFIHGYSASFSVSFKHTVNPLLSSPGVIYFMQVWLVRGRGGGRLLKRGEGVIKSSKLGTGRMVSIVHKGTTTQSGNE